jgi:hypothetical protein
VGQIGARNFACGKTIRLLFFTMSECLGRGNLKDKWNAFNADGEFLLNQIKEKIWVNVLMPMGLMI